MSENHHPQSRCPDKRSDLKADCERCFGLCCVALPFGASSDFAADKDAGQPCGHLRSDFRCGIHADLRQQGYRGCTVFDCFGAGQHVSQHTFAGQDWRQAPTSAKAMFAVFPVIWQLHELLWYLREALTLQPARSMHAALRSAYDETERMTRLAPEAILALDAAAHRAEVNKLLLRVSERVRAEALRSHERPTSRAKTYSRGADLIGAKLKGADLRGANLRGAYLIAADLRQADLREADLIGADLRDTDLRGADLTGAIFLTPAQIYAAKGNGATRLPSTLTAPSHWFAP